ncbi:MAG: flavin reductase family protein [Allosphingosinicella sp.]|uniref:flavin reductase family protein n=1 Tax=Allosphingosinicella sp. TaxID=2823234 RepID=UPI00393D4531
MNGSDDDVIGQFRRAMRRVAATVNVISITVDGQPLGITATAVSSLSMEPPSLLACINRAAAVHASMADMANFRVNILHRDQEDIARMFADRREEERRFAEGWELFPDLPPRLMDAQASILCRRIDHHEFGTHSIFIGVIEDVCVREDVSPLLYWNGQYGNINPC